MKRILIAAGLAVAAMSLPATAALADGYERRVAKPKPKPKAKAQAKKHHAPVKHAKKHHAQKHHEYVVDYAAIYPVRSHAKYLIEETEEVTRSYYEERDGRSFGPVVTHHGSYVNPQRGCSPHAPCTHGWSSGGAHVGAGFGSWGHPGGVGYGVDGGSWGGAWVLPYGHASSSYYNSSSSSAYSRAHAYGAGQYGHGYVAPGHHPGAGHHPKPGHHGGRHGGGHR